MRTVRLLVVLSAMVGLGAGAEDRQDFVYRPASVSFFPPLSTNGMEGRRVSTGFSLNVIGGYLGRLQGAELGGVFNIEEDDARWYQAAGVFNIVGNGFTGLQQAGVVNIVGGDVNAVQMAGAVNVAGERLFGSQFAGAVNLTGAAAQGLQVAGGVNIAGQGIRGTQVAGGVNIAGGLVSGLQLAGGVNIAEEFAGCQVGVVNIAGKGEGLQLGVVNIAEDVDIPIGLISIVEHGQFHVNAWASEFSLVNVGIKTGSRIIYNVFSVGYQPDGDSSRLFAAIGIGGHIPMNRFFLDIDGVYYSPRTGPDWFEEEGSDVLTGIRMNAGWQVTDYLAVTAGPTFSVWVSDRSDGSGIPFYNAPLFHSEGDVNVRIWPGFNLGLQLL